MRDEDVVFDAVARLVSAGEYLDTIPGRPGVDLDDSAGLLEIMEGGRDPA